MIESRRRRQRDDRFVAGFTRVAAGWVQVHLPLACDIGRSPASRISTPAGRHGVTRSATVNLTSIGRLGTKGAGGEQR